MMILRFLALTCLLLADLPLLAAGSLPAPEVVSPAPLRGDDRRPFLLGGIQLNEDDHERWAAALIQAGMNAVEVTVYAHQGAWHGPELWYAQEEPAVLAEIRAARRNGLQVVLILRVALDHNDPANRFLWHGLIYPRTEAQLDQWFRRYGNFVVKWARIARAEGVEVLGLASEMNSLLATLPVKEIPELPAYYLDDAKQDELRQLVSQHSGLFGDAEYVAMGAGDFTSLDDFLVERNRFERNWARAYTFASEAGAEQDAAGESPSDQIHRINRRRRLLERHWQRLIDRVRRVYRGRLALAANFDNYHEVSFWNRLDFIGINAYFPLRPSLETPLREAGLTEAWRGVFAEIETFRETHGLEQEVVFTELGYTRRQGVTVAPWSSSGFVPMWDDEQGDSVLLWSAQPIEPGERALAVRSLHAAWQQDDLPLAGILYWKLSSRLELGRYEPFMLYLQPGRRGRRLGDDSEDPLFAAFARFSGQVRPLEPTAGGGRYARWAAAVARGDLEAAAELAGRRRVKVPRGQRPPLHLAVQLRRGDVVRQLVRQGADLAPARVGAPLARRDAGGYLPLHWSCYQPDPGLVALLLPPEKTSWRDGMGETPLQKCARLDNPAVMRELLRHRPDLADSKDGPADATALRLAADLASVEMVDLLISHGAGAGEPDREGVTPLHAAARRGDGPIVERMLKATGAEVQDSSGNRPVSYAAYFGKPRAFRLLWTPETAKQENAGGQSLLHLAAHGGDVEIIGTLLRHGFELNRADRSGRTPLHYATMKTHRDATRLLLEHGAALDRGDREGVTVLHLAAEKNDPQLLQLILARAHELDVASAGGNTPLHRAAGWGRLENVRLLLAAGALSALRNDNGQTALDVAEESGRKRVVELLRNRAALSRPSARGER